VMNRIFYSTLENFKWELSKGWSGSHNLSESWARSDYFWLWSDMSFSWSRHISESGKNIEEARSTVTYTKKENA